MVTLPSLQLLESFIAFEWYENSYSSYFAVMNTSHGPNFPTMVAWFNGKIPKTLNLDFMFSFFKDYCKALSTHVAIVVLSGSSVLRHAKFF